MVGYFLAVMVLLAPLAQVIETNMPNPIFGDCNQKIINAIKNVFWAFRTPTDFVEKVEENGYILMYTSFHQMDGFKCIRTRASSEQSKLDLVFYNKNGSEPGVLSYKIEGKGPVYTTENGKTNVYPIILNDITLAYYVCSPGSDAKNPQLITVFTSTKSLNNPFAKNAAKMFYSLLRSSLGDDVAAVIKSYDQCIFG